MQKVKLEFTPGCFNDWEGSQEELDALIEELYHLADTGELLENAERVSIEELEDAGDVYVSRMMLN